MPVQATTTTIVQQSTTDATRGRVAGALNASIQAASIGSMAVAGILADVVGIRWVFAGGAAVAGALKLISQSTTPRRSGASPSPLMQKSVLGCAARKAARRGFSQSSAKSETAAM